MIPIFLQTTYKKGFSLIEVLIAVAIVASSLILILPQMNRSENKTKKVLRELQSLNRTLYSYSRIKNKSYRLALQLNRDEPAYWVEIKRNQKIDFSKLSSDSLPPHPFFEKDNHFSKETLPKGLFFDWPHETPAQDILYIIYDPHYFSDSVTILLRKNTQFAWTLFFNPLLGELEIVEGEKSIALSME